MNNRLFKAYKFFFLCSFKYSLTVYLVLWLGVVVIGNMMLNPAFSYCAESAKSVPPVLNTNIFANCPDGVSPLLSAYKYLDSLPPTPIIVTPKASTIDSTPISNLPSFLNENTIATVPTSGLKENAIVYGPTGQKLNPRVAVPINPFTGDLKSFLSSLFPSPLEKMREPIHLPLKFKIYVPVVPDPKLLQDFHNGIMPGILLPFFECKARMLNENPIISPIPQFGPYSIFWLRENAPYLSEIINKNEVPCTVEFTKNLMNSIENPAYQLRINDSFNTCCNFNYQPFNDPLRDIVHKIIPDHTSTFYKNTNLVLGAATDAWALAVDTRNPLFFHAYASYVSNLVLSGGTLLSPAELYNDAFLQVLKGCKS